MNVYKWTFFILTSCLMITSAYCQVNSAKSQVMTVSGTVSDIDFVGNTISILTSDQNRISFYVPANAVITRNTQNIGLMDIKPGHPVTIQYDVSSPAKYSVDSIVDNPVVHEQ